MGKKRNPDVKTKKCGIIERWIKSFAFESLNALPFLTVTLTYDYWIGKFEVTFEEYDEFCEAANKAKPKDLGGIRGTTPVIHVSWFDGIAYCNWLSGVNGLPQAYDNRGNLLNQNGEITTDITQVIGFRLPTEAE